MGGNGRKRTTAESVVVVGAGASGMLAARALLRAGQPHVVLVERDESWSRGPAYATRDPQHLLNVAAGHLGVDSEDPAGFTRWASGRAPAAGAGSFLPRSLYGAYLDDSLSFAARVARRSTLTRITGHAVRVERTGGRTARIVLADGRAVEGGHVVLALGNPAARRLGGDADCLVEDPWSACETGRIDRDDSIVIVGTGLTAVDVALSLVGSGHRGSIRMLSRHGLLPRAHAAGPRRAGFPSWPNGPLSARALVRCMRAAIDDAAGDWRAVFDSMRGDTNAIWNRLPEAERARLLRHARRYWEVHRHRMAPSVATRIEELVAGGRVEVHAGTVVGVEATGGRAGRVVVRGAGGSSSAIEADRVVNCTGPDFDLRRSHDAFVRHLLTAGIARPGALGLGFDVAADGSLVDGAGRSSGQISLLGPLRRGAEWETTAIPDIRAQVEALVPRVVTARRAPRDHGPARTRRLAVRDRRVRAPRPAELVAAAEADR